MPATRPAVDPATVLATAKDETAQALRDIREAHRRGPKPNSRPLPVWVRRLAWVLDDAVAVPGTGGRRIGVDGIIAFVPGVGDAAGLVLSMIVVLAGVGAGVSFPTVLRMLVNVGAEGVAGLIPFGGPVIDMAFKANQRNVRLIEADLADRRATRRSSIAVIALTVFTLAAGAVMTVAVTIAGLALFAWFLVWLAGRL